MAVHFRFHYGFDTIIITRFLGFEKYNLSLKGLFISWTGVLPLGNQHLSSQQDKKDYEKIYETFNSYFYHSFALTCLRSLCDSKYSLEMRVFLK